MVKVMGVSIHVELFEEIERMRKEKSMTRSEFFRYLIREELKKEGK